MSGAVGWAQLVAGLWGSLQTGHRPVHTADSRLRQPKAMAQLEAPHTAQRLGLSSAGLCCTHRTQAQAQAKPGQQRRRIHRGRLCVALWNAR